MALDLANDVWRSVGGERDVALELEAVDRLDQADSAHLLDVLERLAPASVAAGERTHQRQMALDQLLASAGIAELVVAAKKHRDPPRGPAPAWKIGAAPCSRHSLQLLEPHDHASGAGLLEPERVHHGLEYPPEGQVPGLHLAVAQRFRDGGLAERADTRADAALAHLEGQVDAAHLAGLGEEPLHGDILAGALTLTLVILPIIIIASIEALRAVPEAQREGAYALGATRWQVTRRAVLPAAGAGIITGIILAIARAIGEAAPLILVGAVGFVTFVPTPIEGAYTVLPIQIFDWASRPQEDFQGLAAATIVVLLVLLLILESSPSSCASACRGISSGRGNPP